MSASDAKPALDPRPPGDEKHARDAKPRTDANAALDANSVPIQRAELVRSFAAMARDPATPLAKLRDQQERLRLVDAALADPHETLGKRRRAVYLAVLAVAAVLSIGALVPVPSVAFSIEAEAAAVRMQMAAPGELASQLVVGDLAVNGYTSFESPNAALKQQDHLASRRGRVSIGADTLTIRRIAYPAASTIEMVAGAKSVSVTVDGRDAPVSTEVEIAGHTRTRFGTAAKATEADFPFSEWLRFRAGDAAVPQAAPPLSLSMGHAVAGYSWSALRPDEVRFVGRTVLADNQPAVVSSLVSAHIRLPSTDAKLELDGGDELDLAGLDVQHFELTLGPVVRLKMSGTAHTLLTRTGGFQRSLKPSVLEYTARHSRVALLWGAALLLWGLARAVQKLNGMET